MSLKVGLVYDLRSDYLAQGFTTEQVAEFDSDETIAALEQTIGSLGYATERIGHARMLAEKLVSGARWDLVFNIAEGVAGRSRESQAPCLLELYGIPYTFSDPLVCAATLDKSFAKRLLQAHGVRTPRFKVVSTPAELDGLKLDYPLFAKPLAEGTGKGITEKSQIDTPEQLSQVCQELLAQFTQPVLVEEYLPGREFTVAMLGNGDEARVLGTMEVAILPHAGKAIYTYDNKERCEQLVEYSTPPKGALRRAVEALALKSYRLLECHDAARADIRCDSKGRPSFMEINPLPGMHPSHSDLPMIATRAGLSYKELVGSIIQSALRRQRKSDAYEAPSRIGTV